VVRLNGLSTLLFNPAVCRCESEDEPIIQWWVVRAELEESNVVESGVGLAGKWMVVLVGKVEYVAERVVVQQQTLFGRASHS
jgi:hypothetical protein